MKPATKAERALVDAALLHSADMPRVKLHPVKYECHRCDLLRAARRVQRKRKIGKG